MTTIEAEAAALAIAHNYVSHLDKHARDRVIKHLQERSDSDAREATARQAGGNPPATHWTSGDPSLDLTDDRGQLVLERYDGGVLELDGWAITQRKYAVYFTTGDEDGNVDGNEIEYFDTREKAEAFLAHLNTPEPEAEPPQERTP